MKNLKQIREETQTLEEDDKKLTSLIRAGLFDASKLPIIKRALSKDHTKMTASEKSTLLDLMDVLLSQVTGDKTIFNKVKHNAGHMTEAYEVAGDLPPVLILRRKAIRVYPDGQRVALYWVDKLKTYISVPYSQMGISLNSGLGEEVLLKEQALPEKSTNNSSGMSGLQKIAQSKSGNMLFEDGSSIKCTVKTAKGILKLYDQLNGPNKDKIVESVQKNKASFMQIAEFASKKVSNG